MSFPTPRPGLVLRYSYLWKREYEAGREDGVKDRPCAVMLVAFDHEGRQRVRVLPITHARPFDPADALEIPPATKLRLGLDAEQSWIVLTESNDFLWPGPDLRFLPGQGPESAVCGLLPPGLLKALQERLAKVYAARRMRITRRTE